jgi:phage/conjugal plasmid C-4 type zinc finger TraR family protein
MPDFIDETQERMDAELASRIASRTIYTGQSAHECDCGDSIPEARRLAVPGVKTCVACAERGEIKRRSVGHD